MPFDENGVKWACEPCIRGHRSSKCAHYDRLMVSVGKAGRPLSKCPHVEGHCNCKRLCAFMVAIPKGTGCLCRPVYKMLIDDKGPNPTVTRVSLDTNAAPGASPSKIQKSSKKSVKPAPEQVERALSAIPEFQQHSVQNVSPAMSPFPPAPQMVSYPHNTAHTTFQYPNNLSIVSNLSSQPNFPGATFTASMVYPNNLQPTMQPNNISMPMQPQSSCCVSSGHGVQTGVEADQNTVANGKPPFPFATGQTASAYHEYPSLDEHFPATHAAPNGLQPSMPDFLPYASTNGTSSSASVDFAQTHFGASQIDPHLATAYNGGAPHRCSCGPKCNCFACPDHPYNDVTVQHIQEMGRIIAQDEQVFQGENNNKNGEARASHANESEMDQPFANPGQSLNNGFDHSVAANQGHEPETKYDFDTETFTLPAEENLMIPDAYYTYEYQVGLPGACAGEAGSCQCGPSCSCLGCLTHGNPAAVMASLNTDDTLNSSGGACCSGAANGHASDHSNTPHPPGSAI